MNPHLGKASRVRPFGQRKPLFAAVHDRMRLLSRGGAPIFLRLWVKRTQLRRRVLSRKCCRARCSGSSFPTGHSCSPTSPGKCASTSFASFRATTWKWNFRLTISPRRGSHSGQSSKLLQPSAPGSLHRAAELAHCDPTDRVERRTSLRFRRKNIQEMKSGACRLIANDPNR